VHSHCYAQGQQNAIRQPILPSTVTAVCIHSWFSSGALPSLSSRASCTAVYVQCSAYTSCSGATQCNLLYYSFPAEFKVYIQYLNNPGLNQGQRHGLSSIPVQLSFPCSSSGATAWCSLYNPPLSPLFISVAKTYRFKHHHPPPPHFRGIKGKYSKSISRRLHNTTMIFPTAAILLHSLSFLSTPTQLLFFTLTTSLQQYISSLYIFLIFLSSSRMLSFPLPV
jgi:hypothetical protein